MIEHELFFKKYQITAEDFESTGLAWASLESIYDDYVHYKDELESTAAYLLNSLMKASRVHSVRYRIKDPEHLVEKIIRKKLDDPASDITMENYREKIKDLIGLRALHLFKEDWEEVNKYINEHLVVVGKPEANYRQGDSTEIYAKHDCEIKMHKYGYRSVHYIIETRPAKTVYFAEIQVRTIFEEAWAEIDHTVRYPYDMENELFAQFLLILNRLAGSADEMGSYILMLKAELNKKAVEHQTQLREKDELISGLQKKLEDANLEKGVMERVNEDLKKLKEQKFTYTMLDPDFLKSIQTNVARIGTEGSIFRVDHQPDNLLRIQTGPLADFLYKTQTKTNIEKP